MKKIMRSTLLWSSIFFLITSPMFAQSMLDSLRFKHRMLSMQKKSLVLEYMRLTEAEKSSFWPVYESYADVMQNIEIECLYLVFNYARNTEHPFVNNTSQRQRDLSTQLDEINARMAKIRKHYFKKFKKALSEEQALAFMQLDMDFHTTIVSAIPGNTTSTERASVSF